MGATRATIIGLRLFGGCWLLFRSQQTALFLLGTQQQQAGTFIFQAFGRGSCRFDHFGEIVGLAIAVVAETFTRRSLLGGGHVSVLVDEGVPSAFWMYKGGSGN